MAAHPSIVIAGAGIGGLTAALALRARGFAVRVFERVPTLRPVGAGLTLQHNAMRALASIGLDEAVAAVGHRLTRMHVRGWDGRVLQRLDAEAAAVRWGAPMIGVHRAALHRVLVERVGDDLTLGAAVTGFEERGDGVRVALSNGETVDAAMLVGADGIRSVVRAKLHGEAPLRYAGYTSWRGVCGDRGVVGDAVPGETWGRGLRFGWVPVAEGIYWFAVADAPEGGADAGDPREGLRAHFKGWHAPVEALIGATAADHIVRTDIHDRPPLRAWGRGRVTLLGDAAHPMTPNLGQGACQAIEDAVVLARELARDATSEGLRRYEAARIPRTTRVVNEAWRFGKVGQASNPLLCTLRDAVVALTPDAAAVRAVDWLYDFRPEG